MELLVNSVNLVPVHNLPHYLCIYVFMFAILSEKYFEYVKTFQAKALCWKVKNQGVG